jgi:hypothetical protein
MATYNFGIVALQPSLISSHVLGFAANKNVTDGSMLEIWDGPNNTNCLFAFTASGAADGLGDLVMGDPRTGGGIDTADRRGFIYLQSCAGTPTGNPAYATGNRAALVYDRTNHRLYINQGLTWRSVAVT